MTRTGFEQIHPVNAPGLCETVYSADSMKITRLNEGICQLRGFQEAQLMGCFRLKYKETAFLIEL